MLSVPCARSVLRLSTLRAPAGRALQGPVLSITSSPLRRTFTMLSLRRPTLISRTPSLATPEPAALPTSQPSALAPDSPSTGLLQVRGSKRNTYNPSHVVRKRRHGFLSRLRTRTGRRTLIRRRIKDRNTASH